MIINRIYEHQNLLLL